MVSDLIDGKVDPLIALSKAQNRDSVLNDPRWGNRNTTTNWCNHAWPFLKDYQSSLAKSIANRAFERYEITDTNNCFRGVSEYSMDWATVEEEDLFNSLVRMISEYAVKIDKTLDAYQNSRWSDYGFANYYKCFLKKYPQIPKFHIRTDVSGESGKTPGRTGVYVSQDDNLAALQFAWTGNGGGKLRSAKTFSEIGLDALRKVGRKDLWLDDQKMFDFAIHSPHAALFQSTIFTRGNAHIELASGAVEGESFVNRPCKWYFVEIINGELEDVDQNLTCEPHNAVEPVTGGDVCRQSGFYFTPSKPDSRRRLIQGETAPNFESQYGETIWQWDIRQD